MSLKHTFLRIYFVGLLWSHIITRALAQEPRPNGIPLLEPIDGQHTIGPSAKLGPFFEYFNLIYPWAVGMAAGIAVLMTLVGGIQIILSGGDQGKRQAGTERMWWAIAGLMMLAFSSLILKAINPVFFQD